jgi:hypothetical protein
MHPRYDYKLRPCGNRLAANVSEWLLNIKIGFMAPEWVNLAT